MKVQYGFNSTEVPLIENIISNMNVTLSVSRCNYRLAWDIALGGGDTLDSDDKEIDLSQINFINDIWEIIPTSQIIIKTSIFLPVVIWGIFANIILLSIIIRSKSLHTPINLLIGNMAVADLISLLIHPWIFLIYDYFQNYQLGKFGCKFESSLECALFLASVMNLLSISYDRLNAITIPQQRRLTILGAKIAMAAGWIIGVLIAMPLYCYRQYKEREWYDFLEKFCTEDVVMTNIYWHIIITMAFWLPLTIMLICYITLYVKLNQYEKNMLQQRATKNISYKKKVARMMFVVVITFMICRLPFTALIFYRNELLKGKHLVNTVYVQNQVKGVYHALWFTSRYLIFLNCAINPVIYGMTSENFKRAFKQSVTAKWFFPNVSENDIKTKTDKPKATTTGNDTRRRICMIFKIRTKNSHSIPTVETDCRVGNKRY